MSIAYDKPKSPALQRSPMCTFYILNLLKTSVKKSPRTDMEILAHDSISVEGDCQVNSRLRDFRVDLRTCV